MTERSRGTLAVDPQTLQDAYTEALHRYLQYPDESTLSGAYDLGRRALNEGLGPLDLVLIHQTALGQAPAPRSEIADRAAPSWAAAFLLESLSPFEMTYRRFLEANAALRGLNEALENESRRTARQIHDGAGQILFTLQLTLTELTVSLPQQWRPHLDRSIQLADQLDEQLRSLSRDLYPVVLDDLGLNTAVRNLVEGVATRADLTVSFQSSVQNCLPPAVAFCLYRAVHEAITNVVRHAQASELEVSMARDGARIVCSVRDNGVGIPGVGTKTAGLGLLGIRERLKALNGELELTSSPGRGTRLVISIPVTFQESSNGHQGLDC